jgi:hypothetical protein
MTLRDAAHELGLLIRSRHPLVVIESVEADRIESLLRLTADGLDIPLMVWSPTRGLGRVGLSGTVYETAEARAALAHVASSPLRAIYHFPGLSARLDNDLMLQARLREAVDRSREINTTIFLTGLEVSLPGDLHHLATPFALPGPSEAEFRALLGNLVRDLSDRAHVDVDLTKADFSRLLRHLHGLTLMEAEKILTKALVEDRRLTVEDIQHVIEAKKRVIEREGLLEYYPPEQSLTRIADLAYLKKWLRKRKAVVEDPDAAERFGLAFPKGVLLLGVPGCGKSLCAKAVAGEWRLPLLKLDPSRLYNKYIGETEKNLVRAIEAAERMAPVVLWIDELEKAFASGGGDDSGVSMRVLGSFLSWMQERSGNVFVVATANQIERVPPELLRKGRFDEIFFVDLPGPPVRAEIFEIHLSSRGHESDPFDLGELAHATDGFSGAEIEQVVVSALFSAFSDRSQLTQAALLAEVASTVPLSVTMAERIEAMRTWAKTRTTLAH